jgi:hypothetical protein
MMMIIFVQRVIGRGNIDAAIVVVAAAVITIG